MPTPGSAGSAPARPWPSWRLARAQAALGKRDEARKSYQAFFEFWKDADPDVPLLVQARDEFAKLGSYVAASSAAYRIVFGAFCPSGISVMYF